MQTLLLILIGLFGALTLAGLVTPWWVLWWMSHQNRMKVLKYYGILLVVLLMVYLMVF